MLSQHPGSSQDESKPPNPQSAIPNPQSKRRRLVALICVPILIFTAAGIGLAVHRNRLPRQFAAVEPGVLYRSSQPSPRQLTNAIADYGIKTIIIAREASSDRVSAEIEAAGKLGLRIEHLPLVSSSPISEEHARRFFDIVDNPANRPILVHCSQGRHRTGYLCGLYRIERQGWTLPQAVEEMQSFCADEEGTHAMIDLFRQYKPQWAPQTEPQP